MFSKVEENVKIKDFVSSYQIQSASPVWPELQDRFLGPRASVSERVFVKLIVELG